MIPWIASGQISAKFKKTGSPAYCQLSQPIFMDMAVGTYNNNSMPNTNPVDDWSNATYRCPSAVTSANMSSGKVVRALPNRFLFVFV